MLRSCFFFAVVRLLFLTGCHFHCFIYLVISRFSSQSLEHREAKRRTQHRK